MKLAIMQPYFFPYIGYFQLINAVDTFVFYDDVNFIKGGWINRNRILINNKPKYINAQLIKPSSFSQIKDIDINNNFNKLLKTIEQNYKKATYFNEVFHLIKNSINSENIKTISDLNINLIRQLLDYLEINTKIEVSSSKYFDTKKIGRTERIIELCKRNNANTYINAEGGKSIYKKDEFIKEGIELFFMKSNEIIYKQFDKEFSPNLSIIDVLMFNSKGEVKKMLENYSLD